MMEQNYVARQYNLPDVCKLRLKSKKILQANLRVFKATNDNTAIFVKLRQKTHKTIKAGRMVPCQLSKLRV